MARHNIPTAEYRNFRNYPAAEKYSHSVNHNVVLKASRLAAGKGVIIAETQEEVLAALKEFTVDRALGDAGNEVVIEEFLDGQELSILTSSDGVTFKSMPPAQDHKRSFDGDKGPNTAVLQEIDRDILEPTFGGLRQEGKMIFQTEELLFLIIIVTLILIRQEFHSSGCSSEASCSQSQDRRCSNTTHVSVIQKRKPSFL